MWQAEADKELTLSASPATAVGEKTLTLANRRYSTVLSLHTTTKDPRKIWLSISGPCSCLGNYPLD